jgi:hypothetical protein
MLVAGRPRAPVIKLSKEEIALNMRAVAHAIAQQELEGLRVPESVVSDLHRAARGEIDTEQIIRGIRHRFENVPILRA